VLLQCSLTAEVSIATMTVLGHSRSTISIGDFKNIAEREIALNHQTMLEQANHRSECLHIYYQCWAPDTIYPDTSRYLFAKTTQIRIWCSRHISGTYLSCSWSDIWVPRYISRGYPVPNRQLCPNRPIDKLISNQLISSILCSLKAVRLVT
jgi:hypothetical protein